jgi:16S rRNA (adenine(1408)-N(1))-methyltransferase
MMEILRGKQSSFIDASTLTTIETRYQGIHIDIGTGDGRFVAHSARMFPNTLVIGIDACRENLHDVSRRAPANALFVIANALALPSELNELAGHITINFPWGSLIEGLLDPESALLAGLPRIAQPRARLDVRLNGGALGEAGWSLEDGTEQVWQVLTNAGFKMGSPVQLAADDLRAFPTTWAKRLAFGRDPRAMQLRGIKQAEWIAQPA